MVRDYQKSRVYKWEDEHVHPRDRQRVPFNNIQAVVNHIWEAEGLLYPPIVEEFHANVTTKGGTGCRTHLQFPEHGQTTAIIIHEIAHAMNSALDDRENDEVNDRHGPKFVGIYMQLLEKYLKMNLLVLMHTAKMSKVDFDILAVSPLKK